MELFTSGKNGEEQDKIAIRKQEKGREKNIEWRMKFYPLHRIVSIYLWLVPQNILQSEVYNSMNTSKMCALNFSCSRN